MPRHYRLYLEDMLAAGQSIQEYVRGLSKENFLGDKMRVDAVIRNYEIIGEAAGKIPLDIQQKYPAIEWRRIASMRNVLIHEYFGINKSILWDLTTGKLPALMDELRAAIQKES